MARRKNKPLVYTITEPTLIALVAVTVITLICSLFIGEYKGVKETEPIIDSYKKVLQNATCENERITKLYDEQAVVLKQTSDERDVCQNTLMQYNVVAYEKLCQPVVYKDYMFMTAMVAPCGEQNATWIRVQ